MTVALVSFAALGCDESPQTAEPDFMGLAETAPSEVDASVERPVEVDASLPLVDAFVRPSRLNSVFPARSPVAGGVSVRIVGQEFVEGMVVRVGNRGCSQTEVVSENHVRCVLPPAMNAGPADVVVTWPDDSGSESLDGAITYFQPIELARVDPQRAPRQARSQSPFEGVVLGRHRDRTR